MASERGNYLANLTLYPGKSLCNSNAAALSTSALLSTPASGLYCSHAAERMCRVGHRLPEAVSELTYNPRSTRCCCRPLRVPAVLSRQHAGRSAGAGGHPRLPRGSGGRRPGLQPAGPGEISVQGSGHQHHTWKVARIFALAALLHLRVPQKCNSGRFVRTNISDVGRSSKRIGCPAAASWAAN